MAHDTTNPLSEACVDLSNMYHAPVVQAVFNEYRELLVRRGRQDWTGLATHAGRFIEALAKLVYEMDTGRPDSSRSVARVAQYLQDNEKAHQLNGKDLDRVAKYLLAAYKLRSSRNLVHFADLAVPQSLDGETIVASCKWLLAESLRISWDDDPDILTDAIRAVATRDLPSIGRYGDRLLLERNDCTQEQEVVLLMYAAGRPVSRAELAKWTPFPDTNLGHHLSVLKKKRIAIDLERGVYALTDHEGIRFVEQELGDKLTLE